ncbi:helix-turn-helix domain-containing protein [Nocardia amamiensis]|uniref:helix-turn-helix domain-containing protein n=1 Tax=Nocardia amamiensis TaxID=404578 RepID=UPI000832308A|nr:transcriptional regulator [Nocardia amamiensis]
MIEKWTGADVLALRTAMRLTQEEFAAACGRAVRTVGKWEQQGNEAALNPRSSDVMDTLLNGLSPEQAHRFYNGGASLTPAIAIVSPPTRLHSPLDVELRTWVEMNRRELLSLFGGVAGGLPAVAAILAGLDSDEQLRVGEVLIRPDRVDKVTVGHIEAALEIARSQNNLYGPHAVLPMVSAQQAITSALLRQAPSHLQPRLLTLHSQLAQLAGWMQFDLCDFGSANSSYEQARESAHDAGNDALVTLVLCNLSYLATWRRSPRIGIDHAVAAQNWARSVDDRPLRAYADDMAAFAYATTGRHQACVAALDAADATLEDVPSEEDSVAYFHGPGLSLAFRSDCMYRLGCAAEAQSAAESSLALIGEGFTRNRALASIDLAHAHIAAWEIDEAAQGIGKAAGLATECRSDRLTGIILDARADLDQWNAALCVRELDQLLADYGLPNSRT